MDERLKELRLVLSGMHTYVTENAIAATRNIFEVQTAGVLRASGTARLRGVTEFREQYELRGRLEEAQHACVLAALQMGRQVLLRSAPDTLAVLHWPTFRNPAVLTLESRDRQLLLCCVTAKNVLAERNAEKIFRTWQEAMPDVLKKVPVSLEPQCIRTEKEPEKQKKEN